LRSSRRAGASIATLTRRFWGARGVALERQRVAGKRTLPANTPTIDDFSYNVALSIKSIDLNAPWYGNPANLSRQIDRYVDQLQAFESMRWGKVTIGEDEITGRVLDIIVPTHSGTPAQQQAIAAAVERARTRGVYIRVTPY
jgi:hypothetical protein